MPPLALTMGEPGGVGGEIAIKAWRALQGDGPCFFMIDDPSRLESLGAQVGVIDQPAAARDHFSHRLPVLPLGVRIAATPGKADKATAPHVIASIRRSVELALSGAVSGVVTNPIQKASLLAAGFEFPGHTEFLGALTKAAPMSAGPQGARRRGPVMMIAGPSLKTVPVTIHASLTDAIRMLTTDMIVHAATVAAESLVSDFGIARPRLAVAGLNPHAGEGGKIGTEDRDIVAPAVAQLKAAGIDAVGPLPADTMFHAEARARYDAAICIYHDQALIPAKTLAFHEAVNVTLGLPIIRTSPDHGTALDIAGKGIARADSLIAAIRLAADMAEKRARR
ncbi:MAG: 4-hydroxythreonine-4-phosphate dehydrogenase PdxA [Parvularculaceae bacterium]